MAASMNRIRGLKLWQMGLVVVVLLVAGGAAYTVYARSTSADDDALGEDQQLFNVAYGDLLSSRPQGTTGS